MFFSLIFYREVLPFLYGYSNEIFTSIRSNIVQSLRFGQNFDTNRDELINPLNPSCENDVMDEDKIEPFEETIKETTMTDFEGYEYKPILDSNVLCFNCYIPIKSPNDLKDHLETSPKCSEKNFMCPHCPRFFDSAIKVIRHKVVHKDSPKYPCEKCQKVFKSKRILQTHNSKVHGIHPDMKFKCSKCPQSFNFETHLKAHFVKHSLSKQPPDLFCDQCDQVFHTRSALSYHKAKHVKSEYPCNQCTKSFKSDFGLKYHLKIHNNEAPYLCDDCGQKFISPYKLIQHRRSKHTQERPYICEECGEGFVRNDKLTVHKRRAHTGERPYPCDQCDWRGVDSSSLIHHKKKHNLKPQKVAV